MSENESGIVKVKEKEYPFQIVQEIYNSITNKTESLSRLVYSSYLITPEDIKRFHRDIGRALETYSCSPVQLSVYAVYADGRYERFNSLQKFLSHAVDADGVMERLDLDYDFLLLHSQSGEAKKYQISLSARSKVGVKRRLAIEKASDTQKEMFRTLDTATGRYTIEYIDHTIAIAIQAQIERWYGPLSKDEIPKIYNSHIKVKKMAPHIGESNNGDIDTFPAQPLSGERPKHDKRSRKIWNNLLRINESFIGCRGEIYINCIPSTSRYLSILSNPLLPE